MSETDWRRQPEADWALEDCSLCHLDGDRDDRVDGDRDDRYRACSGTMFPPHLDQLTSCRSRRSPLSTVKEEYISKSNSGDINRALTKMNIVNAGR